MQPGDAAPPRKSYGHGRGQSYDVFYQGNRTAASPVLIFVTGGGWQGLDHINAVDVVAEQAVRAGFVTAVLYHRPAAISATGTAAVFVAVFSAACCLLPCLVPAVVAAAIALVLACKLHNKLRGAGDLPLVVHDVARG
eukprot:CAMPEP_0119380812 /NCGR_PEP_ID=MMETSP1334-20130426/57942_1 /TAXON_ID=127549 /ORGANISM="Calcidiscus leptoporus, Strain RCC1130" /LENGTH=137 /DNA_ID=CAMNT_0007400751 /DNA_START=24 /DNA_END=434 /DNA_ORIENTATION=+